MSRKVIRNAKCNYYNSLLMTAENKSKTTWSFINKESGKGKNENRVHLMFRSDKTFFQIQCAVETCNDYFLNVIEKLNIENLDINSVLLSLNKFSFPFLI
jgi:hypothetical protein